MSADSWKITLPCTRQEAEAIDSSEIEIDAVLTTSEVTVDQWRLDAYVEDEPDAAMLAAIAALAPSAAGVTPQVEALTDADWVAMSQAGLEPIREGRFLVHTSAHPADVPAGGRAFLIDAGQAFGTGHHFTTAGCLAMLDTLADRRFDNAIDLGTGTGLLAFAARHLWPEAQVMATDIDPVAIRVAEENVALNGVERVGLLVADGTRDPAITAAAPYDLVIANILAGPLVAMAPEIAAICTPGATIVLAGLLATQADGVIAAYQAQGCTVAARDDRADWTILRLEAPAVRANAPGETGDREAWAGDR
jgi:ribosomal protein L11 methyltransferase